MAHASAGGSPAPDVDDRGVYRSYLDADDRPVTIGADAVDALRAAIGEPPPDLEDTAPLVVKAGAVEVVGAGVVSLETGGTVEIDGELPLDLPTGYHRFAPVDGPERDLIVSPGRCHLPADLHDWGFAVQLYAARSAGSWGIGDLADLDVLRRTALDLGARFVLVNPLHAPAPGVPQERSPYSPTTRRFANPLYLRPERVPGGEALTSPPGLNDEGLVDRDTVWTAKLSALRQVYDGRTAKASGADAPGDGGASGRNGVQESERTASGGSADPAHDFEAWRAAAGPALQDYATWCALAEAYGPSWREWPEEFRHPSSAAVAAYADEHAADVGFHAWLQWALATQLAEAAAGITVIQDLPIGFSPDGADAWAWQDLLADGFSVGAPPDLLNGNGQDWGLPPFVPWKLRAAGYQPFIQSMRATIAGAGGLRIDHVMGLFRLWWVPAGASPLDGGYVQYPSEDLLDILALESERAGALVVGEDLGTVEAGVPAALSAHQVLSYKLLLFEDEAPGEWPALSMAAASTHDLPTVAGLVSGVDREVQQQYDVDAGEEANADLLARLELSPDDTAEEATVRVYEKLARAGSGLRTVTLEDAVLAPQRPNLPGVTTRPENWSLPLSVPVDELAEHPLVRRLAEVLNAGDAPDAVERARTRYLAVADGFAARLAGIGAAAPPAEPAAAGDDIGTAGTAGPPDDAADSWTAATPCPDWTVRDLVTHVVDTHRRIAARLTGEPPRLVADDADRADLPAVYEEAAAEIRAALADERATTEVRGIDGRPTTYAELVGSLLMLDTLIHTWDLARATGQDETLDRAAVAFALPMLVPLDDAIRSPGGFGPKLDPPPGASAQTTLLNFCGRSASPADPRGRPLGPGLTT